MFHQWSFFHVLSHSLRVFFHVKSASRAFPYLVCGSAAEDEVVYRVSKFHPMCECAFILFKCEGAFIPLHRRKASCIDDISKFRMHFRVIQHFTPDFSLSHHLLLKQAVSLLSDAQCARGEEWSCNIRRL